MNKHDRAFKITHTNKHHRVFRITHTGIIYFWGEICVSLSLSLQRIILYGQIKFDPFYPLRNCHSLSRATDGVTPMNYGWQVLDPFWLWRDQLRGSNSNASKMDSTWSTISTLKVNHRFKNFGFIMLLSLQRLWKMHVLFPEGGTTAINNKIQN